MTFVPGCYEVDGNTNYVPCPGQNAFRVLGAYPHLEEACAFGCAGTAWGICLEAAARRMSPCKPNLMRNRSHVSLGHAIQDVT
jgi:hypothetical protein